MAQAKTSPTRAKRPPSAGGDVIVDVLFEDGHLFLCLANIGPRPARQIRVTFNQPLWGLGGQRDFASLRLFQATPFLAPGRSIRAFFDSAGALFARGGPTRFSARVTYVDERGKSHVVVIEHDLGIYADLPVLQTGDAHGRVP